MEERKHFLDYAAQAFATFGFTMFWMIIFTILFGKSAKDYSPFFSLGNQGIPVEVMFQFLALSILLTGLRYFFFTDRFLKKMSVLARCIWMPLSGFCLICAFIMVFHWFPVEMWLPWVLFILSYLCCFGVSLALSVWRTRWENRKLEEGLERLKKSWEEETHE